MSQKKNNNSHLTIKGKIAVFIDAANLELSAKDRNKGHLRKANFDVEIAVEAMKRLKENIMLRRN